MGCAVRVGRDVVDHEGDSCPGEDLLQHRSPPYRTNYNRSVRSPQHSPVPITDQWQPTACATLAPRGSRARLSTPILCRKPLLFLLSESASERTALAAGMSTRERDGEVTVAEMTSGDFSIAV